MAQGPFPTDSHKVWLVTGASSGLGKRIVMSALKRGDFVVSSSRSAKPPADFFQSPRLVHRQLDVDASTEEITARVEECINVWGRIDVLVNNAGTVLPALLEEGGSAMLKKQMQTNLFGLLDVTTAVLPQMRERRSGTLVMCSSRSSWRTDVTGLSLYATSKIAVRTLGECFAVELAGFNIKVLITEAGAFRTEGMLSTPFYKENPLPGYDEMRTVWEPKFQAIRGHQRGDPEKAAELMVDFVRGEGAAKGRPWAAGGRAGAWPCYLPLGVDAEVAIREKCELVLETCDELSDVIGSTDFDEEK
ncbi:NAD(P)-binding protein [Athelia psychrophila]|uniref:NAD(P)-binding protein n=1 Tax=Athelia psychrophila TaxID=1759441 RepID=A0A166PJU1_9AGAM|nr:NAD(P)-binding protein [Fibularhizoctonia sp. CBS 109695]